MYTQKWGLEISLKKTRCVIFSKGHTKYDLQNSIIIRNDIIPFEDFYKYLGVEISDDCKYFLVKKERVKKAGRAINVIKQLLRTTGNVSPKLGEILFESKIEPILTYGSIIWAVENSTNNVVMHDIAPYLDIENTRKSIYDFFKDLWKGYCPDLDQVRVLGKKEDVNRPVMVKFANLKDKENSYMKLLTYHLM